MKFSTVFSGLAALVLLSACASVPMQDQAASAKAKTFAAPQDGKAGLYVYRSGSFGGALKKNIWVDGKCLGESAPNVFFYTEVDGNQPHTVATESEFGTNQITLHTLPSKNYFVRQYIKMGAFVGGANVEQVSEETGKATVMGLNMAAPGICSR